MTCHKLSHKSCLLQAHCTNRATPVHEIHGPRLNYDNINESGRQQTLR